jgi:hypothetical protein
MTHVHEDLGAYVLGSLDSDDAARVRAHLAECPRCAAAHAELAGLPPLLDLALAADAVGEEPLPPTLEERLLDRFARERPARRAPRRWRRLLLGGGGALVGAALAVGVLLLGLGLERPRTLPPAQYRLSLQPAPGAPVGATARVALRSVEGGTVVRLWAYNLPRDPGDVYEVLCESKSWSASAGTFRVDAHGDAYVILTTAARRGQYDSIRVVRRSGGHSYDVLGGKLA